mmetsp:Transcript_44637/g.65466  ORF Transcript_44637/g.65466 Transcript_44637/m.65466 type:complete len:84 (+) Transcript_44637:509-760(+)
MCHMPYTARDTTRGSGIVECCCSDRGVLTLSRVCVCVCVHIYARTRVCAQTYRHTDIQTCVHAHTILTMTNLDLAAAADLFSM